MKLPWLALLFLASPAFVQSPAQQPVDPDQMFQLPDHFKQHAPGLGKLKPQPFLWGKPFRPIPRKILPPARPNDQQIDPEIIRQPPWHGESKGKNFAHHLYPDLKFLPLRRSPPASK